MGLMTIVSDAEGLAENVIHGETGWVVPKMKPKILSKFVIDVINLDKKNIISINARRRVLEKFNLDNQAKLFNAFYSFWEL